MLRRCVRPAVAASSAVIPVQRRQLFTDCHILANLAGHGSQLVAYPATMSALLSSPIATVALIPLTYNVCVVGLKHLNYTLELFFRDYLQDPILLQVVRYMIFITLIVATSNLFVEV
jgi:hypothetical protein